MKLSIIIVHYRTYTLTKQTIDAVLKSRLDEPFEIILIDNASRDGSIEQLKQDYTQRIIDGTLKIYENEDNLGFSKANNRGIGEAEGEYILLLNSDTKVAKDCLKQALEYIAIQNPEGTHRQIGALGCKVILADGTLDHACKRGFPTPQASLHYFLGLHKKDPIKYGQYQAAHVGEDEIGEVDCLTGAFMLMPRYVLDEVGLLDEDFFMYGEDIDLCYRIKQGGYRIVYYPEAQTIHYKGGSSKKRRRKIIYAFHHAMWLFYKKHYDQKYSKLTAAGVYVGIQTRYIIALLKNMLLKAS